VWSWQLVLGIELLVTIPSEFWGFISQVKQFDTYNLFQAKDKRQVRQARSE
jgi:hypothetical protein